MTTSKKAWSEPELIVLVRSKPGEAVLTGCLTGGAGTNSNGKVYGCYTRDCLATCNAS